MSKIQHGDIIFCIIGPDDNPISNVEKGIFEANINHCGVIIKENESYQVLESFPSHLGGVQKITLEDFKKRSQYKESSPRILIGRIKDEYTHLLDKAIKFGIDQLGKPYDFLYSEDKESFYCSELILDMFNNALGSYDLFPKTILVFNDKHTGQLLPHWKKHYTDKGLKVPYNSLGSHPSSLSRSDNIVYHTISVKQKKTTN